MKMLVEFEVPDSKAEEFHRWLQLANDQHDCPVIGYRADDFVHRRNALTVFANEMETVLRRHDNKKTWREKPIEALFQLLLLEVQEARVAMEYFSAREAQHECVDVGNFAMIVHDRLGMLEPDQLVRDQLNAPAAQAGKVLRAVP